MREFVAFIEKMTDTVRFIIGAVALVAFLIVISMATSISLVAPQVADNYGERAERLGERAIQAAQEQERARELAQDGWGYADPPSNGGVSRAADDKRDGGWAQ